MQSSQKVLKTDNIVPNKKEYKVIKYDGVQNLKASQFLINEEPLLIVVENRPYMVIMRTPGGEESLAAGFCFSEGIVDDMNDFASIGFREDADMNVNVADIKLKPERHEKITSLFENRGILSKASCGISGKVSAGGISRILTPATDITKIPLDKVIEAGNRLADTQYLYPITRGTHAVMLLNRDLDILSMAEDVGRHNALDKAVGTLLMSGRLEDVFMGVLSSRVSFEMLQKANRAGIPFLLSGSRPTSLAVDLGREMNMTLVCLHDDTDLIIFSGEERILM